MLLKIYHGSMATQLLQNHKLSHLLSTEQINKQILLNIFELADYYLKQISANGNISCSQEKAQDNNILANKVIINLFFENSTRTRTSFELAAKNLGAKIVNINVASSAISKGEGLRDMMCSLAMMGCHAVIVRHQHSGVAQMIAQNFENEGRSISVINAGDGAHQHPTQALLDVFTIAREIGIENISARKIAICGDIKHSRVARSNIELLKMLGAEINLISPPGMMPVAIKKMGVSIYDNLEKGIKDADILICLRLQKERMSGCYISSEAEYFKFYGLDYEKIQSLASSGRQILIMHPGPLNRGVEIDSELADFPSGKDDDNPNIKSLVLEQVLSGLVVRQAVLHYCLAGSNKYT